MTIKFKGELAKPITIRTRSVTILTDTPEHRAEYEKFNRLEFTRALAKQLNKIDLLRNTLGLGERTGDPAVDFAILALVMAQKFVPGFKIKNLSYERGKGRIKEWDTIKYSELLADVQILRNEKTRSDSDACRVLATTPRFKKRWGEFDERTLKNRLVMAKDENKNLLMHIANRVRATRTISEDAYNQIIVDSFGITENRK